MNRVQEKFDEYFNTLCEIEGNNPALLKEIRQPMMMAYATAVQSWVGPVEKIKGFDLSDSNILVEKVMNDSDEMLQECQSDHDIKVMMQEVNAEPIPKKQPDNLFQSVLNVIFPYHKRT